MKSNQPKGYTVLELMIVIAVSATMFITVAVAFGGRQQQIQFTQAVRDLDARILDVVNDVSTGYYGNTGVITCTVLDADPDDRPDVVGNTPATAEQQGSSDDCVTIGKAIQFAPLTSIAGSAEQPSVINIYNIVGRRNNNGTVNSLQAARPVAVASTADGDPLQLDDQVSKIQLQWGLEVIDIFSNITPANDYGTIGFFTSFTQSFVNGLEQITLSNNQSVKYGAIPNTFIAQSPFDAVTSINSITDDSSATSPETYIGTTSNLNLTGVTIPNPVTICVRSPDDKRRAAIVIGSDGATSTQVQFDNYDVRCDA